MSSFIFFATGIFMGYKRYIPSKYGFIGTFTLLYAGSLMEFDNLVTLRSISKKRPGYWVINSGVLCVGVALGNISNYLIKQIKNKRLK